jgi:hypothetical protein
MSSRSDLPGQSSNVPQHDIGAYVKGKGIGETLVDLARPGLIASPSSLLPYLPLS